MTWSKFLDPKNDYAFKRIFGTDKNKEILIHFLNDLLSFHIGAPIEEVTFLNPVLEPETAAQKQSIVDILCVDAKGAKYIIEMQVARTKGFEKRAQFYAAKVYAGQIRSGEDYDNLKEIIFLAVVDFVMFPKKENYHSDHIVLDRETHEHDLKDVAFCFLELPKFTAEIDQLRTPVERWAYFFKHAPETYVGDLDRIAGSEPVIKAAYEALDRSWWSEEEFARYEQETKRELDYRSKLGQRYDEGLEEGDKRGYKRGRGEGKEEGLKEGKEEGLQEGRLQGKEEGLKEGKEEGLQKGRLQGKEEGLKEGKEEGLQEGRLQGKEEGLKEGKEEGLQEGRLQGKEEGLKEGESIAHHKLAMSLLKSGFSIGEVNRLTGLGPEELDALENRPPQAAERGGIAEAADKSANQPNKMP
jgi:predicted transposase/invertase (TIGR01784 family)